MNAAGNFPVGAEIIPQAPPTDGAAPWERAGGGHHAPDDPAAQARARKWQEVAGEMSAADAEVSQARAERQAARARKKEEAAAKAAQNLEDTAVRMFRIGFAALPFVWLVSLLYFRKEMKNPEANPRIKKCALFFFLRFAFQSSFLVFVCFFVVRTLFLFERP